MFFCGKHIGSLVNVPNPEVQITVIYCIRKENLHTIGPRIIGHTPMKLKNLIPLKPYIRVQPCWHGITLASLGSCRGPSADHFAIYDGLWILNFCTRRRFAFRTFLTLLKNFKARADEVGKITLWFFPTTNVRPARGGMVSWLERPLVKQEVLGLIPAQTKCFFCSRA